MSFEVEAARTFLATELLVPRAKVTEAQALRWVALRDEIRSCTAVEGPATVERCGVSAKAWELPSAKLSSAEARAVLDDMRNRVRVMLAASLVSKAHEAAYHRMAEASARSQREEIVKLRVAVRAEKAVVAAKMTQLERLLADARAQAYAPTEETARAARAAGHRERIPMVKKTDPYPITEQLVQPGRHPDAPKFFGPRPLLRGES